jgi:hypothetical protein
MYPEQSEMERLALLYSSNRALFQEELDYMYLDSVSDSDTFLKNIQKIFGGDAPDDVPWMWEQWANDIGLPWRSQIAKVVSPVANRIFVEIYRREMETDEESEREYMLEAGSLNNVPDDQLADIGMLKCEVCGHILTFNGSEWYMCSHDGCTCTQCAERVVDI